MKVFFLSILGLCAVSLLTTSWDVVFPVPDEKSVASLPVALPRVDTEGVEDEISESAVDNGSVRTVSSSSMSVAKIATSSTNQVSQRTSELVSGEVVLQGIVTSVIDGDTLKVQFGPKIETIRVIGIDTPETVHPSQPVECFGREASAYATALLASTVVTLVTDKTQGTRDKYDRRLGYITLADGRDFGAVMIAEGFAFEYTYDGVYEQQARYQRAEREAREEGRGLWAVGVCDSSTSTLPITHVPSPISNESGCVIKGNISRSGEKIFHVPGQQNYPDTMITESVGERYFCTEADAISAGWRKALR